MKNIMIKTAVLTALLCMAALLPACSPETGSSESTPVSSQTSQTSSQSGGMRDDPSSEPEDSSSDAGGESSEDSSGQNSGILPDISADDPAFVRLFAENPIDRDYANEVETAASTGQMLAVNNRYIDLWKAEVDGAYRTLLEKTQGEGKEAIQKEQQEWAEGIGDAIASIDESAQGDGSARQQHQRRHHQAQDQSLAFCHACWAEKSALPPFGKPTAYWYGRAYGHSFHMAAR